MTTRVKLALGVACAGAIAVTGTAAIAGGGKQIKGALDGFEEVPAVSTTASGKFRAVVTPSENGFTYKLSYSALEGDVTQAHIHVGQPGVNGGVSVFFCSNLGNGPAGTQACPPGPATVEGTIEAAGVLGPAAQGIAAGELAELIGAIRGGVTYANVHSTKFPGGEIRSQLRASSRRGGDHDGDEGDDE
ncbi:MAG TPA: CHRD domain-containing protein [Solirubrobacteraceae bacterium]|nr:CHRD domain-containing protein [Solirubrobacteraceae bacterium]